MDRREQGLMRLRLPGWTKNTGTLARRNAQSICMASTMQSVVPFAGIIRVVDSPELRGGLTSLNSTLFSITNVQSDAAREACEVHEEEREEREEEREEERNEVRDEVREVERDEVREVVRVVREVVREEVREEVVYPIPIFMRRRATSVGK
ncbi:hypothetical protein VTO73DRAFT_3601 [Trametes versicolor]